MWSLWCIYLNNSSAALKKKSFSDSVQDNAFNHEFHLSLLGLQCLPERCIELIPKKQTYPKGELAFEIESALQI